MEALGGGLGAVREEKWEHLGRRSGEVRDEGWMQLDRGSWASSVREE